MVAVDFIEKRFSFVVAIVLGCCDYLVACRGQVRKKDLRLGDVFAIADEAVNCVIPCIFSWVGLAVFGRPCYIRMTNGWHWEELS